MCATICHSNDCGSNDVKLVHKKFSDFCSKQNSPATKGNVSNTQQMIYKIRNSQSKWLKYDGKSNKFQCKYCKCVIQFVVDI